MNFNLLHVDRITALSSAYYCCDFDYIQQLVEKFKEQWANIPNEELLALQKESVEIGINFINLQKQHNTMQENLKDLEETNKSLITKNRELEKKLSDFESSNSSKCESDNKKYSKLEDEVKQILPLLIASAFELVKVGMPVNGYTRETISKTINSVASNNNVQNVKGKWIEFFRIGMPEKLKNKSGASSQKKFEHIED